MIMSTVLSTGPAFNTSQVITLTLLSAFIALSLLLYTKLRSSKKELEEVVISARESIEKTEARAQYIHEQEYNEKINAAEALMGYPVIAATESSLNPIVGFIIALRPVPQRREIHFEVRDCLSGKAVRVPKVKRLVTINYLNCLLLMDPTKRYDAINDTNSDKDVNSQLYKFIDRKSKLTLEEIDAKLKEYNHRVWF